MLEKHYDIANDTRTILAGDGECNLQFLEKHLQVQINTRNEGLLIRCNDSAKLSRCISIISRMEVIAQKGTAISPFQLENLLKEKPVKETYASIWRNRVGQSVRPKTEGQVKLVQTIKQHDITFIKGPAGTGKTFLAVAHAVAMLEEKTVDRIALVRPAVEAGENLGFLPGDLEDKIAPYLRPLYDAITELLPEEKVTFYNERNLIEVAPLAYMRGRTLKRAFVILDEAQNTTIAQMKMFLTRIGPNSKVIITGDTSQIDLPKHQKSGFDHAISILNGIDGIGFCQLSGKDVQRHTLVKDIIHAYEQSEH